MPEYVIPHVRRSELGQTMDEAARKFGMNLLDFHATLIGGDLYAVSVEHREDIPAPPIVIASEDNLKFPTEKRVCIDCGNVFEAEAGFHGGDNDRCISCLNKREARGL